MTHLICKTTLVAATFAAVAAYSIPASARIVPGSEYGTTQSEEASRASVSNPAANVAGTTLNASRVYGYNKTVPGSDYDRMSGEEDTRDDVRRMTGGTDATRVNPNSARIVPGSDYGSEANEVRERASVL
ncbi:hypothetical protein U0C82_18260 [Fulvimarina sp. 2208YS6-2-32]|uniref:DUF4148 domain-containing protein n=1 Tax=Fulvimarina uroteuthidis TaxID=3098149 RepID=A0ABU5I6Q6_9HYPH|nr:hypothetical protein [Fulvimarina sp. 2208YS6-2-32]MDY8111073.1 hypothetical protein [Fulvimarina sp. 2208YS6-2-32]